MTGRILRHTLKLTIENASGEKCVSLSATEDPQFDKDVEGLYIHHGQIHIEGQAHESD